MSVSAAAVLTVMLARPAWVDRAVPAEERIAALGPIATAIAEAVHSDEEAAALVLLGRVEGENFALAIVRGGCTSSGCDHGAARGVFQEHRSFCPAAYVFAAGSIESIRAEARCAVGALRLHASRCREHALTPWHGAFSGFATGHSCHWSGADDRVRAAQRVVVELRRAEGA